jgi:hypothetical protein
MPGTIGFSPKIDFLFRNINGLYGGGKGTGIQPSLAPSN